MNQIQSLLGFTLPDTNTGHRDKLQRESIHLNADGMATSKVIATGGSAPAAVRSTRVRPGQWVIVTVTVNPCAHSISTYINGLLCHEAADLEAEDLRLQNKLVVLGGGKQAHSRGGDLRRVLVHDDALDADAARAEYWRIAADSPTMAGPIARAQAVFRGWCLRMQRSRDTYKQITARWSALQCSFSKKLLAQQLCSKKIVLGPDCIGPLFIWPTNFRAQISLTAARLFSCIPRGFVSAREQWDSSAWAANRATWHVMCMCLAFEARET